MPPRRAQADVALYGATGYTGRLAAHAMAAAGLDVILAGRNQEALEALAQEVDAAGVRVAASDDPEALLRVAESAAVLVSCAGPFAEVGELVVAAAIAAGRHYLDSTGETTFMAQTHRRHDARARAAGVVVMNSCAFEYVLGDCAAELALIDLPEARELDVAYHVDHPRLSQGTALSALGIMASGKVPVRSRRFTFSDGAQAWAASYPGGETELVPRRHPGVAVTAWLSLPPAVARLAPAASGLAPLLGSGPVRALVRRAVARMPTGPTAGERARQRFVIDALARGGGKTAGVSVRGADPYGLTGEILARTAARLARGEQVAAGVLAPSEAFEPEGTLAALADLGVEVARL
ncbi:MAG TPA: saccharopine dehydrogenase NADP-binding domain-containing protein [Candidatus Dormibacteraeota bacterium]|nr:saccharopine dehydrogenase NADP-binding domain-containing protein [Candidatus Dormibacteraeota bacterium]